MVTNTSPIEIFYNLIMLSLLWCLFGIVAGIIFGVIPGAGPFLAIASLYSILLYGTPVDILIFYVSLLITSNYMNSITGILYGIPGDAAAAVTAHHGHRLLLKGEGHMAVSSNAVSSTIGTLFAVGLFLYFLPSIYDVFKFYNSTVQVVIISIAIILLTLTSHQSLWKTILLFVFGGIALICIGLGVGFVIFGSTQPDPSEEIEQIIERKMEEADELSH